MAQTNILYPVLKSLPGSQIAIQYSPATGQKLLRFTTTIVNVGEGPFEVDPIDNPTNSTTLAYQVLYGQDTSGKLSVVSSNYVGQFTYSSYAHAWYFSQFSSHEIRAAAADGSIGDPVTASFMKVSCCISDDVEDFPNLPNAGPQTYTKCSDTNHMGLTVGWADIYGWRGRGQTIDISTLPDGDYYLMLAADPNDVLLQGPGASTNNISALKIHVASDLIWMDDSVPASATTTADGGDSWLWTNANPTPYLGALSHQSSLASGQHDHAFSGASASMAVATNNTMLAYVYLDPAHPPTEIMLQWNDGTSSNHRAYWGANSINLGTNGAASRYYAGALPPTGQWVRLEVPAAQVGLEGVVVSGMTFSLYNGRAWWDSVGVHVAPSNAPPLIRLTAPSPQAALSNQVLLTADANGGNVPGPLTVQFQLDGANFGAPGTAAPYQLSWDTTTVGNGAHTVTAIVSTTNGIQNVATPISVLVNNAASGTTVWLDDWLPAGAVIDADGGDWWNWITNDPPALSGAVSHQSSIATGMHGHSFDSATQKLQVNAGDTLFSYVYLDPDHLPSELMLEWNDGASWEHRAFWGANSINLGQLGTASRLNMGTLPAAGQWVRLAVPANALNLAGSSVAGMAFELFNGRAAWDESGVQSPVVPVLSGIQILQLSGFQFSFPTENGASYVVEQTADFTHWVDISTNTGTGAVSMFNIASTNAPLSFFRLRLLTP